MKRTTIDTTKPLTVVIYLRISRDIAGEELGVERQKEKCVALAAARGWKVVRVYCDNDVSATSGRRRPQWEAMMEEIEAGRVDVVISTLLDRVLRSGKDRIRMLDAGRQHGLVISLVKGSDLDLGTVSGRVTADILGALAQSEIEIKSDRQIDANRQAAEQGRRIGGRRPFGFEDDGVTLRPIEADAIAAGYTDFLTGIPLSAIARRWNRLWLFSGVVNPETGEWTQWGHSGVRHMMSNPRYMGMRRYQPNDGPEMIYPATWPAIVDETTWRAVNVLLDSAAAEYKPRGGRRLLTGHATCGVCELTIHVGGTRPGSPRVYRCPTGKHVSRRAEPIEAQVGALVVARTNKPDVLDDLAVLEGGNRAGELATQAEVLRTEMDALALERTQRKITTRQFSIMNADLMGQLEVIERQMSTVNTGNGVRALIGNGLTMERWNSPDFGVEWQRVVLTALADVRIWSGGRGVRNPPPNTVQVRWRGTDKWVPPRP